MKLILRGVKEDGHYDLSDLVDAAHGLGLEVHPYTFRVDQMPDVIKDFNALLELFIVELGVDALFTDFTDRVAGFMRNRAV